MAVDNGYAIQLKNISKSFPGVQALKNVSLNVEKGKVHALVGENGAGKSTLMKVVAGVYQQDEGDVVLAGNVVHIKKPADSIRLGISMIHQELNLVPEMTVSQNIFLGQEPHIGFLGVLKRKQQRQMTKKILEEIGSEIRPEAKVSSLSVAEMQMVEIAKAISINADLIIMDEPSSAITDIEVEKLFEIIENSKKKGIAIVYITHKMDELFRISDYLTVLRDGEHVGTFETKDTDQDSVVALMVGREISDFFPKLDVQIEEVIFEVRNLTKKNKFNNINFQVRRGEILGISGLMGAGRTEIAEAIFGIDLADSGEILIHGEEIQIRSPRDSYNKKMAFVPEDRKLKGLHLVRSVGYNITLANLDQFCRFNQVIRRKLQNIEVDKQIEQLDIKTTGRNQDVNSLSGGNQQKVVLAKSLVGEPDIFIFDEPTRGIDVGAKAEIHKLMSALVSEGKGVIMISSELPEILGMSDRVIVLYEGEIKGEFLRSEFDQKKIMDCAMGHSENIA